MLIIDRFEGDWAVIEYGDKMFWLPRALIPETAKEGDILNMDISVAEEASDQRREDMRSLLDDFFDE